MAEREIGGVVYTCEPLPAEQGLSLLMRFMRIAGPAAGILETAIRDGANLEVLHALAGFMSRADTVEVEKLILELARLCRDGGEQAKAPNLGALLRLAAFALEAQFADFFDESLAGAILRRAGGEALA